MAKIYTDAQIDFLRIKYKKHTLKDVVKMFNLKFGMNKKEGTIQAALFRNGIKYGHKKRPLTKGAFRKGNIPATKKPLYSERVSKEGYIEIKVPQKDPYSHAKTRWIKKHVYIWEQNYGPVPAGFSVIFKNSDKSKCEKENLMLVSKLELLRLNQNKYKKQPAELKPTVLALSKLQAGISAKKKGFGIKRMIHIEKTMEYKKHEFCQTTTPLVER